MKKRLILFTLITFCLMLIISMQTDKATDIANDDLSVMIESEESNDHPQNKNLDMDIPKDATVPYKISAEDLFASFNYVKSLCSGADYVYSEEYCLNSDNYVVSDSLWTLMINHQPDFEVICSLLLQIAEQENLEINLSEIDVYKIESEECAGVYGVSFDTDWRLYCDFNGIELVGCLYK